jgi:hypothetical protein
MSHNITVKTDIDRLQGTTLALLDRITVLEDIVDKLQQNIINLLKDSKRCSGCGDHKDVLENCIACINRVCYRCNIPAVFGRHGEQKQVACSRRCELLKPKRD